jgi:hypothetical protein
MCGVLSQKADQFDPAFAWHMKVGNQHLRLFTAAEFVHRVFGGACADNCVPEPVQQVLHTHQYSGAVIYDHDVCHKLGPLSCVKLTVCQQILAPICGVCGPLYRCATSDQNLHHSGVRARAICDINRGFGVALQPRIQHIDLGDIDVAIQHCGLGG